MSVPIISIIMPVYNASQYIRDSIGSILNQTFQNFELIVIDDGSTDKSVSIIETFHDERIKMIKNRHDYIASLNIGLKRAQGEYLVRMDADDIMLPDRLGMQLNYMELHPSIAVCGSYAKRIGDATGIIKTETLHGRIITSMLLYNPINHPTVIIRRSSLGENMYSPGYPYAEDYKLWTDLVKKGLQFANIPNVLLFYRCSSTQVTNSKRNIMFQSTKKIQLEYAEHVIGLITAKTTWHIDFISQLVSQFKSGKISQFVFLQKVYFIYQSFLLYINV